jgi:uncharacterized ferredoxin-like protein
VKTTSFGRIEGVKTHLEADSRTVFPLVPEDGALFHTRMKQSADLELQAALQVAALAAAAARTAPKTRGIDNIRTLALEDAESRSQLISKMRELAVVEKRPSFERDANCIAGSPVILLVGVADNPAGLNCGFCGQARCGDLKSTNGVCAFNLIDLGIAVSSAVAAAGDLRVDNRIMYSIGYAALLLGLLGGGVRQILGVPLSITGKSPFFDRR